MGANILTLEEVKNLSQGDSVYVEIWGNLNRHARFILCNEKREIIWFSFDLFHVGRGGRYSRPGKLWIHSYNCSWRCWDKEPSKDEMAHAPRWDYPRYP